MASAMLPSRSPLDGILVPGRYGAPGVAGVTLSVRHGCAVAGIVARKENAAATGAAIDGLLALQPVDQPRAVSAKGATVIGVGPGQWLAVATEAVNQGFVAKLAAALGAVASVTDATSATVIVDVSGPRARDVLSKGCPIDLDARAFQSGSAGRTRMAHIDCTVWLPDATSAFAIALDRSMAQSFWTWLIGSAAEYGYEVTSA
jgi:methylglutamate dehydrogenase subunit D